MALVAGRASVGCATRGSLAGLPHRPRLARPPARGGWNKGSERTGCRCSLLSGATRTKSRGCGRPAAASPHPHFLAAAPPPLFLWPAGAATHSVPRAGADRGRPESASHRQQRAFARAHFPAVPPVRRNPLRSLSRVRIQLTPRWLQSEAGKRQPVGSQRQPQDPLDAEKWNPHEVTGTA